MEKTILILFIMTWTYLLPYSREATEDISPDVYYLSNLELNGKITNPLKNDGSYCKVELISGKEIIEVKFLHKRRKKFTFLLRRNMNYTIRLSGKGLASRVISVDTKLPDEDWDLYRFRFSTSLPEIENSVQNEKTSSNSTLAFIYFHNDKGYFYYSKFDDRLNNQIPVKLDSLLVKREK